MPVDLSSIVMTLDGVLVTHSSPPNENGCSVGVSFIPTDVLEGGIHTVTIGAKDTSGLAAKEKSWTFAIIAEGPEIKIICPLPGETVQDLRPLIAVEITSSVGVDLASVQMTLDGALVDAFVFPIPDVTDVWVLFIPDYDLGADNPETAEVNEGMHTVTVKAKDSLGIAAEKTWNFSIIDFKRRYISVWPTSVHTSFSNISQGPDSASAYPSPGFTVNINLDVSVQNGSIAQIDYGYSTRLGLGTILWPWWYIFSQPYWQITSSSTSSATYQMTANTQSLPLPDGTLTTDGSNLWMYYNFSPEPPPEGDPGRPPPEVYVLSDEPPTDLPPYCHWQPRFERRPIFDENGQITGWEEVWVGEEWVCEPQEAVFVDTEVA